MEYEFEEWAFKSLDEITDRINDGRLCLMLRQMIQMERLGIATKRKPAKVIDIAQYIENNRGTNDQYHKTFSCRNIVWRL